MGSTGADLFLILEAATPVRVLTNTAENSVPFALFNELSITIGFKNSTFPSPVAKASAFKKDAPGPCCLFLLLNEMRFGELAMRLPLIPLEP